MNVGAQFASTHFPRTTHCACNLFGQQALRRNRPNSTATPPPPRPRVKYTACCDLHQQYVLHWVMTRQIHLLLLATCVPAEQPMGTARVQAKA